MLQPNHLEQRSSAPTVKVPTPFAQRSPRVFAASCPQPKRVVSKYSTAVSVPFLVHVGVFLPGSGF
jgi:hypothetical protein